MPILVLFVRAGVLFDGAFSVLKFVSILLASLSKSHYKKILNAASWDTAVS